MSDTSMPSLIARYLPVMLISAIATALCWAAAGPSLGLFFGGVFVVTLMAPPLASGESTILRRLLAGGAAVDGVGLVFLVAVFTPSLTVVQWLIAYLLVAMYAAALVCLTHLLIRWRLPRVLAGGLVMLIAWAWLLWPIWLSPVMTETLASVLTPTHPLMGMNALLKHLGVWTEQGGVIYRLTTLNQDVPHALPASPWPAIVLHAMIALGSWLISGGGVSRDRPHDAAVDVHD